MSVAHAPQAAASMVCSEQRTCTVPVIGSSFHPASSPSTPPHDLHTFSTSPFILCFSALDILEYSGINVKRWLHGFDSVYDSVNNRCGGGGGDVARARRSLAVCRVHGTSLTNHHHDAPPTHPPTPGLRSVAVIRNHPLVPASMPVHGLVIHPVTGLLEVVVDGHKRLAAIAAGSAPPSGATAALAAMPSALRADSGPAEEPGSPVERVGSAPPLAGEGRPDGRLSMRGASGGSEDAFATY